MKKLSSVLLVFAFIMGFQSLGQAQMRIINNSACTIYVGVVQEDMNSGGTRCDDCGATGIRTIAPGGATLFQANSSCGLEFWNRVEWRTNLNGTTSTSFNPFYQQGPCNNSTLSALCSGPNPLTAFWVQTPGGGTARVTIQ